MKPAPLSLRQRGLSMVELAIALAVLGLMTWTVASAYGNSGNQRNRDAALAQGGQMRDVLRNFVLNNARLPCPDSDGDGWEGNTTGACPNSIIMGWLPYRSLGHDLPAPNLRAAYGAYRNADASLDLTVQAERSAPLDEAGSPGYLNVNDFIIALGKIAALTPSATYLHLTGDAGIQGAIECTDHVLNHPAFVLVLPLDDRDGDGNRFDGVHADLPGTSTCTQAPGSAHTVTQDDVVIADSLTVLAGWLAARAP
jgi:type II secretory pathway pseudopilin PulG